MFPKSLVGTAATSQSRPLGLINALALTWPPSKVATTAVVDRPMEFILMVHLANRHGEERKKSGESESL